MTQSISSLRPGLYLTMLAALILSGCASSPTISRYTLPQEPAAPATHQAESARTLVIRPISLARYLEGDGIVLQLSDIELRAARNHLWAEPLGQQLERRLQQRLARALPELRVASTPAGATEDRLALQVELDSFQGRQDGMAVVSGRWQLVDGSGQPLASGAVAEQQSLEDDGYPALVRSLGEAWQRVGDTLADRVSQTLAAKGEPVAGSGTD